MYELIEIEALLNRVENICMDLKDLNSILEVPYLSHSDTFLDSWNEDDVMQIKKYEEIYNYKDNIIKRFNIDIHYKYGVFRSAEYFILYCQCFTQYIKRIQTQCIEFKQSRQVQWNKLEKVEKLVEKLKDKINEIFISIKKITNTLDLNIAINQTNIAQTAIQQTDQSNLKTAIKNYISNVYNNEAVIFYRECKNCFKSISLKLYDWGFN